MMPAVPQQSQPTSSDAPEENGRAGLDQAFALFNQMSTQLNQSYSMLEARVSELKGQLALVSAQRMQELAEKERLANRLQSLLDLLPGGVIVIDGQGVVREANPAARGLLGQPLVGMLWRQVIARCFAPRKDDGHEISLRDGRRLSIATRSLNGEPGQLVLLNDLTETRRLQDQLARHERLSALGRMVASLAHQIRTPLSAAMLYAGHLSEQALPLEQQQRFAGRLKERLQELENQVRDMLVFARGDLPLPDRLSPAELFGFLRGLYPRADARRWDAHIEGFGLAPFLHQPLRQLSTGTQHKAALAAALALGTTLLLLDEPLNALDEASLVHWRHCMAEAAASTDRLMLVVSHEALGVPPTRELMLTP